MKILVTGGAGFIGHRLCNSLMDDGHDVLAVDSLSTTGHQKPRCPVIQANVWHGLGGLAVDTDVVIHLAVHNISKCARNPQFVAENIEMDANVAHDARRTSRYIYASSASVYGDRHYDVDEFTPAQPLSAYAICKLAGEQHANDIGGVVLRLSNVYGPGQTPKNPDCGVVSRFIYDGLMHGRLRVYDKTHLRDYTYIDDVIEAFKQALALRAGVWNISSGQSVSTGALSLIVEDKLRPLVQAIEYPPPRAFDGLKQRIVSSEKFQYRTDWKPTTLLSDGIDRTIEWIKSLPVI